MLTDTQKQWRSLEVIFSELLKKTNLRKLFLFLQDNGMLQTAPRTTDRIAEFGCTVFPHHPILSQSCTFRFSYVRTTERRSEGTFRNAVCNNFKARTVDITVHEPGIHTLVQRWIKTIQNAWPYLWSKFWSKMVWLHVSVNFKYISFKMNYCKKRWGGRGALLLDTKDSACNSYLLMEVPNLKAVSPRMRCIEAKKVKAPLLRSLGLACKHQFMLLSYRNWFWSCRNAAITCQRTLHKHPKTVQLYFYFTSGYWIFENYLR